MKIILLALFLSSSVFAKDLKDDLEGVWKLKALTCDGVSQDLGKLDYSLSFHGEKGEYISKTKECTQVEPELYTYPGKRTVIIKQGVRTCTPNPCAADLPATECGKETNKDFPTFGVEFKKKKKTMILSTSDPKSVDCVGTGQKKPAVFTFVKSK